MAAPFSPGDLLMRCLDLLFHGAVEAGIFDGSPIGEHGKRVHPKINAHLFFTRMEGRGEIELILTGEHRIPLIPFTEFEPGCPGLFKPGRNGRSLSGGLGGVVCMTCSFRVTIPIASMDWRAETMANPLHSALFGLDIKGAGRT
jgi:hypothetical protein